MPKKRAFEKSFDLGRTKQIKNNTNNTKIKQNKTKNKKSKQTNKQKNKQNTNRMGELENVIFSEAVFGIW